MHRGLLVPPRDQAGNGNIANNGIDQSNLLAANGANGASNEIADANGANGASNEIADVNGANGASNEIAGAGAGSKRSEPEGGRGANPADAPYAKSTRV